MLAPNLKALTFVLTVCLIPLSWALANSESPSRGEKIKTELFEALSNAENELEGRIAEEAMWSYWFNQSPSTEVRKHLDAGMERREAYDYEAAEEELNKVVEAAPNYAEGYNQRAFIHFLRENYSNAQIDLEKALELEPKHFGALSGLFHVLRIQDRQEAALGMLQQAVTIHPWIQERFALPESMWPESYKSIHNPDQEI